MHRRWMLWVLFCFFFMMGCGKQPSELISLDEVEHIEETEESNKEKSNTKECNTVDSIFVYVCGAVVCEGVYELPEGSRVYEAVEKAGGFTENAAGAQINMAEILSDETRLYIPTIEEMHEEQMQKDGKVNLNTASKEELMTLPGVGEAKASQIIQYREEHGTFQKIEELMNISGIKEGLFQKVKDYIKV